MILVTSLKHNCNYAYYILYSKLTSPMDQSLYWEADSSTAGNKFCSFVFEPDVSLPFHKILSLDLILSQMNSVRTVTPWFFKTEN
jgi:hypothetical protein